MSYTDIILTLIAIVSVLNFLVTCWIFDRVASAFDSLNNKFKVTK